jgi:hypothetical protein
MPEDASYKHALAQCSAISDIWGSEQGICSRKSMHVNCEHRVCSLLFLACYRHLHCSGDNIIAE